MADPRDPYLHAIGRIIGEIVTIYKGPWMLNTCYLIAALDAVADLFTEHARTRVRHNREMREEQREAQRSTRDAYTEGRFEGRGDEFW